MKTDQIEQQTLSAITDFTSKLPAEQLQDMRSLVIAGEPGVALENLCTQIYEYDVEVAPEVLAKISEVGRAMGLDSKYWDRIARADST